MAGVVSAHPPALAQAQAREPRHSATSPITPATALSSSTAWLASACDGVWWVLAHLHPSPAMTNRTRMNADMPARMRIEARTE